MMHQHHRSPLFVSECDKLSKYEGWKDFLRLLHMQSLLVTVMRVPFVFHPIAIVRVMKRNKKRSITDVIFCSQIKREVFYVVGNQFDGENERKTIFYDRDDTRSQSLYPWRRKNW